VLADVGGLFVIPELARQLHRGPACMEAAENGIWQVLMRIPNPECIEPFEEGCVLLGSSRGRATLQDAERMFTRVVETDPGIPEAWNKRATVRYLMGDLEGSKQDCERVLELVPQHFGALSGMCLIYQALSRPQDALEWCKQALSVHPGMEPIRVLADSCERQLKDM